jgi:hypothetical protein
MAPLQCKRVEFIATFAPDEHGQAVTYAAYLLDRPYLKRKQHHHQPFLGLLGRSRCGFSPVGALHALFARFKALLLIPHGYAGLVARMGGSCALGDFVRAGYCEHYEG